MRKTITLLSILLVQYIFAQNTVLLSESFDGASTPVNWSRSQTQGDGWKFSTSAAYDVSTITDHTGNSGNYAWIDFSGTDVNVILELPIVNVSSSAKPVLEFAYESHYSRSLSPFNYLYIEAYNGSAWVIVATLQGNTPYGWEQKGYSLNNYKNGNSVQLRFRGESGGAGNDYHNDILIDDVMIKDAVYPILETSSSVGSITTNSAILGGNVFSEGTTSITERGILYSSSNLNPVIGGTDVIKNTNGTGTGAFSKVITGLSHGTRYYFRAYAINSSGTTIGSVQSFTTNPSLNPTANILYVKKGGTGTRDGSSWANACSELALALKWASQQNATVTNDLKIYVAKGTYKPLYRADTMSNANANDRNNAFVLVNNVKIYGGFAGTEATLADRNLSLTANTSILSGDFNGDDVITTSANTSTITNNTENAYHVVISVSDSNTTVVDGFTITGGNANGNRIIIVESRTIYNYDGGGMYNDYRSSPTITNTTFSGNNTTRYGGGMYNNYSSSPAITNTTFSRNTANNRGGGMYNNYKSSPAITNTTFSGNTANNRGGGMHNYNSSPIITDTNFTGNITTNGNGGGMYNIYNSSPSITDTSFSRNKGEYGGGMYNYRSNPNITNTIFEENTATSANGGGMYNFDNSPNITNTKFTGNIANYDGGGLYNNRSNASVTNTSFIGNSATFNGGGMYNFTNSYPSIINTTFSSNVATNSGGGMYNFTDSSPNITNTTFSGNTSTNGSGGGIYNHDDSNPKIYNSIFWDNKKGTATNVLGADMVNDSQFGTSTVTVEHSLLQLPKSTYPTTGNEKFIFATTDKNSYNQNPLFTDASNGDFSLQAGSPAINAGTNTITGVTLPTTDKAGNNRIIDGTIDMGAYERRKPQTITANNLTKTYGDADFTNGSATSGLPVTYTSGNTAVATIVNNNIHIVGVGTATITVSQTGNGAYTPAPNKTFTLTVNKATLRVTSEDKTKVYDGVILPTTDYSVTYNGFVNNETASVLNGSLTFTGTSQTATNVGTHTITPNGLTSDNYDITFTDATLTITKASLTVTADAKTKVYDGAILPTTEYSVIYNGLVNNETATVLNGNLNYGGTSKTAKNVGSYTIIPSGLTSDNYNITYANNSLTITKANITGITFTDVRFTYDGTEKALAITGSLPSGTSVTYTNNNKTNAGTYQVTANINGGDNYTNQTLVASLTIKSNIAGDANNNGVIDDNEIAGDVNGNGVIDGDEIAGDVNGNGVIDGNEIAGDVNGNGVIDGNEIAGDVNGNGVIDGNEVAGDLNGNGVIDGNECSREDRISRHWNDALFFDNTGNEYTAWQWYKDGEPIAGATQQFYSANEALSGNYHVVATNKKGLAITMCAIYIDGNQTAVPLLQVYPNPVSQGNQFTVKANFETNLLQGAVITMYNLEGKLLQTLNQVSAENKLTAPNVSGLYIIRIILNNGKQKSTNLVVR